MALTVKEQRRIDLYVERLCQAGCARVREYIEALRSGEEIPELARLEPAEVEAVLEELVAIMAAYKGSCKS